MMHTPFRRFKADFFKALGHPLRLAILDALRDGEQSVTQLQVLMGTDQSSVSQQLTVLRTHGFIEFRKEGTTTYYRARDLEVYAFLDLGRAIFERQLEHSGRVLDESRSTDSGR
jgi:DNA-binding transcriptional ArsR family regulator